MLILWATLDLQYRFDHNLSVAQKPIGLRLAEAEKDPTLPVPLKGKFEPNLGQWE